MKNMYDNRKAMWRDVKECMPPEGCMGNCTLWKGAGQREPSPRPLSSQLSPCTCMCRDLKVVRLFARRPFQYSLPQYYPPIQEMDSLVKRLRHKGLYRDEHLDFKEMMAEQRTARGKGKPKKGKLL